MPLLACLDRKSLAFVSFFALACALVHLACSEPEHNRPRPTGSGQAYAGPMSIDEMAAYAEAIVHAELESIGVKTIRATDRVYEGSKKHGFDAEFMPVLEARFKVIQSLKGIVNSKITVVIPDERDYWLYGTKKEALAEAEEWKSERSSRWDNRQAILFLRKAKTITDLEDFVVYPTGTYRFVGYEGGPKYEMYYSIENKYTRVWLPAASAPSGASGSSSSGDMRFLTEAPPEERLAAMDAAGPSAAAQMSFPQTPSISMNELLVKIAAIDAVFKKGEGVQGYDKCARRMYKTERVYESTYGLSVSNPEFDWDIASGLPARTIIHSGRIWGAAGAADRNAQVTGPDSALFEFGMFNMDASKSQGDSQILTTRPLPKGTYTFHTNHQWPWEKDCGYYPEARKSTDKVNVTAPRGTLHEAFFDPVVNTSTSAVGADGSLGALKPTDFRVTGYSGFRRVTSTTTVKGLYWENNKVRMEFAGSAPRTELSGSFVDVIGLDGKVGLTLDFNKSSLSSDGRSLSWDASKQPWKAGDKLMLRIREGVAGVGGEG